MRAVVQRVRRATVRVEGREVGAIGSGLCVFVGVGKDDGEDDASMLASKVVGLRIFEDDAGKMNLDVLSVGGELLAVSQFTLHGDARKGKRPSFARAMAPEPARELFDRFCEHCTRCGLSVATGQFRAHMEVDLVNDGPVTILIDTKKSF